VRLRPSRQLPDESTWQNWLEYGMELILVLVPSAKTALSVAGSHRWSDELSSAQGGTLLKSPDVSDRACANPFRPRLKFYLTG
jgi:hypothetical protein